MVKKNVLHVLMNGMLVGQLEKTSKHNLTFTYNERWLQHPGARPISLSLPLNYKPYLGDIVYNFFDNLLPDNQQIRARIQSYFKIATNQPFDILRSIGRDCVGAIQFVAGDIPVFEKTITYNQLSEQKIADILQNYKANPLGMNKSEDDFRISIAGAQEKTALLYHNNQWCEPLKSTPTTHILKLPIGFITHQNIDLSESCENEWLCSLIAKAYGIPVAESEVLHFNESKVLAVKRFDRLLAKDGSWIMRLPQEDMCQALGISNNLKYQADGGPGIKEIMSLLLGSTNAIADRDVFFKSQVFFWMIAGIDGHAKNYSIFIEAEGKYRLTPLYDIISAYPLIDKNTLQSKKIKMAMALSGKNKHYHWHTIQRRHFLDTAKAVKYSESRAEKIINEMKNKTDTVIETVKKQLPLNFPKQISNSIFIELKKASERL